MKKKITIASLVMTLMTTSVFAGATNINIIQGNEIEKIDDFDVSGNIGDNPDQTQTHTDTYVSILYETVKCWCAQSFKPSYETLTRIQLYMKREGSPSKELKVSIRKSSLSSSDIVYVTKSASQIPTNPTWVEFDFSDISVEIEGTYYIVAITYGTGKYGWGIAESDKYSKGKAYYSYNGGGSWNEWLEPHDHTFKTFGTSSGPDVLELDPTKCNFGTVTIGGSSEQKIFYLYNYGAQTVTGTAKITGSHSSHFKFDSQSSINGPFSIPPNYQDFIILRFCPTSSGAKSATLLIDADNAKDVSASLSGTGTKTRCFPIGTRITILDIFTEKSTVKREVYVISNIQQIALTKN